eukprot:TRINITY_DN11757_c0_g1_i6.p1 TRINITY_DN11757_c0_g1~~TRINITY_DN11757_c0_g1_i6.p1  ORF type:complete len:488 (+),score=126.70 TRINITY_DN11757_c0_g1_i6:424-1887(+)
MFHKHPHMQRTKALLIERALTDGAPGVLYLDADVLPLAPLPPMPAEGSLGVSAHGIRPRREAVVGKYNGGAFFVRDWRTVGRYAAAVKRSEGMRDRWTGHDQLALTDLCRELRGECFDLHANFNVGWYRFVGTHVRGGVTRTEALQPGPPGSGEVLWENRTMLSAHTHLFRDEVPYVEYNERLRWALWQSGSAVRGDIDYLNAPAPVIMIPSQPRAGLHDHKDDTGRELVLEWGKLGLAAVSRSRSSDWMRWGDVLLYDRPSPMWLPPVEEREPGLYAQALPSGAKRAEWWTFWGRRPAVLHQFVRSSWVKDHQGVPVIGRLPGYEARKTKSVFAGTRFNPIQARTRVAQDWRPAVEVYRMSETKRPPLTQAEYLQLLLSSRFGLCLRGYGRKCNREIEYLALGVVPVCENASDLSGFAEPLREGEHFLRAGSPDAARAAIEKHDSPEVWRRMSEAGHAWYMRNAAPIGSFFLTRRLVSRLDQASGE